MPSSEARRFGGAFGPDPHARPLPALASAYARGALAVLPELIANQWLPPPLLQRLVQRKRGRLLVDAFRDVPHYRQIFREAGLDERALLDPARFRDVPFLTKAHVKSGQGLLGDSAPPRDQLLERHSSGSTGVPVRAYFDPLRELPRRVQELRFLTAHGYRPWHTQMILDAPAHLAPSPFLPQRLSVWRRVSYPGQLSPEQAVQEINRVQPDVFHGVLAGIRMLALSVEAAGGLDYRPLMVVTKGELLDPNTRWYIENTMQAPVVDFYATEETGIIAWECPSRAGYHVDRDLVDVEIVREDGSPAPPGEVGEVVLTNLYQRAMPIIRYRVGDMAAISDERCRCGRGLPLLTELRGRKLDFIITPDGRLQDPFRVMAVMEHVDGVRWFRVIQTELSRLLVRLGWESTLSEPDREERRRRVKHDLTELLGDSIGIEIEDAAEFRVEMGEKAPLVKGLPGQELEKLAARGYRMRI